MSATPFRAINWAPNELISEDKMDQLANNTQWLYENTPRALYTLPSGFSRETGIRIVAGMALFTRRKSDSASQNVVFGNFFSPQSEPVVTTGIISEGQTRIFAVINGYGRLRPDHRGFQVHINIAAERKKQDRIARNFFVSWQALGY